MSIMLLGSNDLYWPVFLEILIIHKLNNYSVGCNYVNHGIA